MIEGIRRVDRAGPPRPPVINKDPPLDDRRGVWRGRHVSPILALILLVVLTACGKLGPPSPPGPADQVIYPKVYPTH